MKIDWFTIFAYSGIILDMYVSTFIEIVGETMVLTTFIIMYFWVQIEVLDIQVQIERRLFLWKE